MWHRRMGSLQGWNIRSDTIQVSRTGIRSHAARGNTRASSSAKMCFCRMGDQGMSGRGPPPPGHGSGHLGHHPLVRRRLFCLPLTCLTPKPVQEARYMPVYIGAPAQASCSAICRGEQTRVHSTIWMLTAELISGGLLPMQINLRSIAKRRMRGIYHALAIRSAAITQGEASFGGMGQGMPGWRPPPPPMHGMPVPPLPRPGGPWGGTVSFGAQTHVPMQRQAPSQQAQQPAWWYVGAPGALPLKAL